MLDVLDVEINELKGGRFSALFDYLEPRRARPPLTAFEARAAQASSSDPVVFTLPSGEGLSQAVVDAGYDVGGHSADYMLEYMRMAAERGEAQYAGVPSSLLDLRYGERAEERLDFLPSLLPDCGRAPTLLWIHGGGWQIPTPKETKGAWVAGALRAAGANVALLEYSAHSPHNLPVSTQCEQAILATAWLARKLRAGELAGDPKRLVVAGHSAGGHLAAVCAVHPKTRSSLCGVLTVAGVGDLAPIKASYLQTPWGSGARAGAGVRLTDEEVDRWSPSRLRASEEESPEAILIPRI